MNLLIKSQMLYQLSYWPVRSEYAKHVNILDMKNTFRADNEEASTVFPARRQEKKNHSRYFTPSQAARARLRLSRTSRLSRRMRTL